jgi:MerR family mercuric resistance operon transcriptional regulator
MASPASRPLSTGEFSRLTGVAAETIRYYERIGLLPPPPRSASGRRRYGEAEVEGLAFVRRCRKLGFGLGQIRTLFALSADGGRTNCAEVRILAVDHLAQLRARIADLQAVERVLADAVARCETDDERRCPVIETLSSAARAD